MSKYREQYDRMKRLYDRFQVNSSRALGGASWRELAAKPSGQSLTDDGLVLFQTCHHLRDWIKNDGKLPKAVRKAAFPHVQASRVLSLCHDIAIGAKHLTVKWPLAQGENPRLSPIRTIEKRPAGTLSGDDEYDFFLPPGTPVQVEVESIRLVMETDSGETVDALAFAGECIKEWDKFLKAHGLLPK